MTVERSIDRSRMPTIGLVPAAGTASRLGEQASSKEVLPLPRPACASLLESFSSAGIDRALVLLRKGKWDIPSTLGDGSEFGLRLAYLAFDPTRCVPETLDKAFPFVRDSIVALGFPDILFEPADAYRAVIDRYRRSSSDVVFGLFPTDQDWKADMVVVDDEWRIREIVIKTHGTGLRYTWSIAVWGPEFSSYLHDRVAAADRDVEDAEDFVGDVVRSAIDEGMQVVGIPFDEGSFLDIGTPEDLALARRRFVGGD